MQAEIRRKVKLFNEYLVRFSELKKDQETFEFLLKDSFFKVFESNEWDTGSVQVSVTASKRSDGITFDFDLKGELIVTCDRCLETFQHQLNSEQTLFVKFGQTEQELDDDVQVVSKDDNQIDLSSFLYEYLVLALPVKKVHPENSEGKSGCDPRMIAKLNEHIITEESEIMDPRWQDLKNLLDKN